MYNNNNFSRNLEYLLKRTGLTKKELEQRIEVGDGYLSRLTRDGNTQEPGVHLMKKLSDILDVTIDELIYQNIVDEEENIKNDEKVIKTIKKIIKDTRALKLKWNNLELVCYPGECEGLTDLYTTVGLEEGTTYLFKSKYGRKYENVYGNRSRGWIGQLNNYIEAILVNLVYENGQEYLELYLNNNEKSYTLCSSGLDNTKIEKLLKKLFNCINCDVDMLTVNSLMDEYLEENRDED